MDKNCIIFLMDMEGHPTLTDEFAEKYRTYAFQDIINDRYLDRNRCVIVSTGMAPLGTITSTTNPDLSKLTKSQILYRQATLDKGWTWIEVTKEDKMSTLTHKLKEVNFDMSPNKTTIIYGGTNTSGCVLHSSNLSLNKFLSKGYYCQLYLPLCDDCQIAGITSIDRTQKAFSVVYDYLKKHKYIEQTDILTRFAELDLIKSNHAYDWVAT